MKYIVLWCLTAFISVEALNETDVENEWLKYRAQYEKSYRSPIQLKRRFIIFQENLKKIEEHNALYAQGKSTHMEGTNQFTDWTNEEFLNYVNKGLSTDGPNLWGDIFQKIEGFKAPETVDWRNKSVVTGVKSQGQCKSGWAFSAAGAVEGQLALKGNLVSLSAQNLIDCTPNSGCKRGLINTAFDYIREDGIQSEFSYPYVHSDGSCKADASGTITKISKFVKIPQNNEQVLRQAIAIAGPISAAIHVTENLQRYKSGILDDDICKNDSLNHGVLIIGYGTEGQRDYYLIKNSWGDTWGEKGYFRLPRNENSKCGVASMASFPML